LNILLLGPTAVGKTETALLVAEQLDIPIISVDSRQCYKHIDIGTAKPSIAQLERVKHHNISIIDLEEKDTVACFKSRADTWAEEIRAAGKPVFYAGGSTLHLQSVLFPLDDIPDANPENIKKLEQAAESKGLQHLYDMLKQVDPGYSKKMDGLNRQRIIRALDVWMQTGRPFSSFHNRNGFELPPDTLVFGLYRDRQNLYERINKRVDEMLKKGLIKETKSILDLGYPKDLHSLNTVGYSEVIQFLNGKFESPIEMAEIIKTKTRRYAKRQLTWFRRWDFIKWLDADAHSPEELSEIIISDLAAYPNKG